MLARQAGHQLDDKVHFGAWEGSKLWREYQ